MKGRQQIEQLLTTQLEEITDHKGACQLPACRASLSVLQSVVDCILEDIADENRPWTEGDVKEWITTMDSQGLCEQAKDIYQAVLDSLYMSKQFSKKSENLPAEEEEYKENNSFFQTEVKEEKSNKSNYQKQLREQIQGIEASIESKMALLNQAETELETRIKEQEEDEILKKGGMAIYQYEAEKRSLQNEKEYVIDAIEELFLSESSNSEMQNIKKEILLNIHQQYNFESISILKDSLLEKQKSKKSNQSQLLQKCIEFLIQMESWADKYPLITSRSMKLLLEIEKDNQYLSTMLDKVNKVYSDDMVHELEGIQDILGEIQIMRDNNCPSEGNNKQK